MRFYIKQNDKRFCSDVDKLVLLEQEKSDYFLLLIAAWAAESLAIGTRKGEQET